VKDKIKRKKRYKETKVRRRKYNKGRTQKIVRRNMKNKNILVCSKKGENKDRLNKKENKRNN
jgi:hypothetical protein